MPIYTVSMYTGRTQRDKDRPAEAITEDAVNILKVEKKDVIVVFQETPHGNWYAFVSPRDLSHTSILYCCVILRSVRI
jgi:4-oxalocrotonate tautomerase